MCSNVNCQVHTWFPMPSTHPNSCLCRMHMSLSMPSTHPQTFLCRVHISLPMPSTHPQTFLCRVHISLSMPSTHPYSCLCHPPSSSLTVLCTQTKRGPRQHYAAQLEYSLCVLLAVCMWCQILSADTTLSFSERNPMSKNTTSL